MYASSVFMSPYRSAKQSYLHFMTRQRSHTKAAECTYTPTHTQHIHLKPQNTGTLAHREIKPHKNYKDKVVKKQNKTHKHFFLSLSPPLPLPWVRAHCVRRAESDQVTRMPCWAFPCQEANRIKPHLPAHCPQAMDCLCLPVCLQTNQSEETNQSQCRQGDKGQQIGKT